MSDPRPGDACPTCGHTPTGLAVEVSYLNRAFMLAGGSERAAFDTAYKLAPDAPRDLLRAIVRYVRAEAR